MLGVIKVIVVISFKIFAFIKLSISFNLVTYLIISDIIYIHNSIVLPTLTFDVSCKLQIKVKSSKLL